MTMPVAVLGCTSWLAVLLTGSLGHDAPCDAGTLGQHGHDSRRLFIPLGINVVQVAGLF